MDRINEVLGDNSLNDSLLIKELSNYIKNHKLKNKKIDKKFVEDIIRIIALNEEGIVNNLECYDDPIFNGTYYEKDIMINLTRINNYKYNFTNLNMEIMSYYLILVTIIHEMTHAKQHYLCDNYNHKLYNSSFEYLYNYYDNYMINHDAVLTERYAEARGIYIAYKVLSYIYPIDKLTYVKECFLKHLAKGYGYKTYFHYEYNQEYNCYVYIGEDYRFDSPIGRFNQIIERTGIDKVVIDSSDMDLFERIYLGLDVTIDEYNLFCKNANSILDSKEKGKILVRCK